jgi:hypothetical protein
MDAQGQKQEKRAPLQGWTSTGFLDPSRRVLIIRQQTLREDFNH